MMRNGSVEGAAETLRVYRRLWTGAEIAGRGGFVERLHREPTLFHVSARNAEQAEHAGPLSLKTVLSGRTTYVIGQREVSVIPGRLLLMPCGVRYATRIGCQGADIFTFYFPRKLVSEALAATALPAERWLDGFQPDGELQCAFPPHVRFVNNRLAALLVRLARSQTIPSDLTLDVLEGAAAMICEAAGGIRSVPAGRASVRQELFRRASLARDRVEAELRRDVPLAELARTACLSPFHLHRIFKAVYGEPPAAMRRRLRMERSRELLARSRISVRDIARAVGFASEAAFSRAFRSACGLTPTAFRQLSCW